MLRWRQPVPQNTQRPDPICAPNRAPSAQRLFSSNNPHLRVDIRLDALKPDLTRIQRLREHKEMMLQAMRGKYPHLMSIIFKGKIAYRLTGVSPEEMLETGGLPAGKDVSSLWVNQSGARGNAGSVCFSLLPDITTLFVGNVTTPKKPYLYAFPMTGEFIATGGVWRQIISPGAFPMPKWWLARELLEIADDNRVVLGPVIGQTGEACVDIGERFYDFYENRLLKPNKVQRSDDTCDPEEYDIYDTSWTKNFQDFVHAHYERQQIQINPPATYVCRP
jgi:hypothetical protein